LIIGLISMPTKD